MHIPVLPSLNAISNILYIIHAAGYFVGVSTLSISVGSMLLVLSMMAFTLLVLSVALCRAKAKLQESKLTTPAYLDQDQLYEEVTHIMCALRMLIPSQIYLMLSTHREL